MNKTSSNDTPTSNGTGSANASLAAHSVLPAAGGDVDEPPIPQPAQGPDNGFRAGQLSLKSPGAPLSSLETCTSLTIDNTDPVWHILSAPVVARQLATDTELGLTSAVVAERIAQYGKNQLKEPEGVSILKVLLAQVGKLFGLARIETFSLLTVLT